jgi:RNA polymerase sigma factor FliA
VAERKSDGAPKRAKQTKRQPKAAAAGSRTRTKPKAEAKKAPKAAARSKESAKPTASSKKATKQTANKKKPVKPAGKQTTQQPKAAVKRTTAKRSRAAGTPAESAGATSVPPTKGTSKAVTTRAKTPTPEQQTQQEANRKLWEAYAEARAPELREQIILQYAPLVKYVMGRLAISLPAVLDYEDILSFGTIGLIEAVERFDYEKGVKFETYAISRIRGAIIDALRSLDRLPRSVRQKAKDADKALVDLTHDLGRDPTDEEVAEAMGLKLEAYRKHLVDASWITVSLDTMGTSHDGEDDSSGALGIADPDEENFDAGLEQQELIGELAGAIRELPEREQLILSLYYKEELTMREVSKVLEISESRVCQLHARALTRLRGSIARMQEGRAA